MAYISDQVFYCSHDTWYTSNGFPLAEVVEAANGSIGKWTFFGRLLWVDNPPAGALPLSAPAGVDLQFAGPRLKKRGISGYLGSMSAYLRMLHSCIAGHDVLWLKANFVAAWLALPFVARSTAFRMSHQVGDPAKIAVGPAILLPCIRFFATSMTRLVHRAADINVFVSRQLSDHYGSKATESWIYNESRLRTEQFVDSRLPQPDLHRRLRLLYVGRLSPEKGISTLIESMAKLDLDCELRLAGSGGQQAELEDLASRCSVREKTHFLGNISWGPALFDLMRESDILVLPSHTEGLPLVLLEAMSQGLPVIASDVGGIPEIVQDEITGLLFPAGDAAALGSAITKFAKDKCLRTKVRENGLRVARENTLDHQLCRMFERLFARLEGTK